MLFSQASSDGHIVACLLDEVKLIVCDTQKAKVIKTITKKDLGKEADDLGIELAVSRNGKYVVGSYSLKRKELISTPFVWNKDEGTMISEIFHLFMFSFFLNLVVIVTSSEKFIF